MLILKTDHPAYKRFYETGMCNFANDKKDLWVSPDQWIIVNLMERVEKLEALHVE
jgi:hypothetical protein